MRTYDVEDTIAAIATANGNGLRGVIRISGPHCLDCVRQAFQFETADSPFDTEGKSQHSNRPFHLPASIRLNSHRDQELSLPGELLVWPTTRSYTRQPSAEFHTIGSRPLLERVLEKLGTHEVRLAQPGEFTLRAFLSGRLDLPQAEAVLSVIDATAETQLHSALRQLAGGLSGPLMSCRDELTNLLAEIEAGLDFVEEDIQFISREEIVRRLAHIHSILDEVRAQTRSRDLAGHAVRVGLIGMPNAGKSTLFNGLTGNQKAIVSEIAGTTTDFLIGELNLHGLKIELLDTAGLEAVDDSSSPSSIGAMAQAQRALVESQIHIKLLCIDSSKPLTDWDRTEWNKVQLSTTDVPTILVLTKGDLRDESRSCWTSAEIKQLQDSRQGVLINRSQNLSQNSLQPHSIENLKELIHYHGLAALESEMDGVGSTMVRSTESLRLASETIVGASAAACSGAGDEIIAADIRAALEPLGWVVGTVYTDDILDIVFSRFCIGK